MKTVVKIIDGALCFRGGMQIDGDGSPRAYAPKGRGFTPLDYLANAGGPGGWYGIITDANGNPVVQGPNDPHPGYYISPTALTDKTKNHTDPRAYVDSENVPYISIPPELKRQGVKLGDLCVVIYGDGICGAIVADIGPHNKFGEASIAVANVMEIPSSPKNGGCDEGVTYIIFPDTGMGWPRDVEELQTTAEGLYSSWDGNPDDI